MSPFGPEADIALLAWFVTPTLLIPLDPAQ
jgi:hypothetical protein